MFFRNPIQCIRHVRCVIAWLRKCSLRPRYITSVRVFLFLDLPNHTPTLLPHPDPFFVNPPNLASPLCTDLIPQNPDTSPSGQLLHIHKHRRLPFMLHPCSTSIGKTPPLALLLENAASPHSEHLVHYAHSCPAHFPPSKSSGYTGGTTCAISLRHIANTRNTTTLATPPLPQTGTINTLTNTSSDQTNTHHAHTRTH